MNRYELEEVEELDPDSTNIFKQNIVGRYIDRPNSWFENRMYSTVDHICFTMFVSHSYIDFENKDDYDSQPDGLSEEIKESPQGISETLPT